MVWAQLAKLRQRLPTDYVIQIAGAQEQSSKGQSSITAGVPVMLFLIFTLLMLQLQSFSRSMLVFPTGPLGIAGVAGALLIFDRPFGFVALLGVIALMGLIMRNSVILIDQIEQDRSRGVPAWDAVVEAAVRRLRPIVLTAAAAVLAMIPLTRSVFWGPMAVAHPGRADRGHRADPAGLAGHVRGLVPGAPARARRYRGASRLESMVCRAGQGWPGTPR